MQNKTAVALGTFDGVHKGHRAVLDLSRGYENRVAVTFESPPKSDITGKVGLITTVKDKCDILKTLGFSEVCLLDFGKVRDMHADEFLDYLKNKYSPSLISCGFNYRFGRGGEGNKDTISAFCKKNGMEFSCAECVYEDGKAVSSTAIRDMLSKGLIECADRLLCKPFSFEAEVITGDRRGRTIGFPTVNQRYPDELVRIKFGVYKTSVLIDGRRYTGITNIGIRPTYRSDFIISETNILGFSGNLYGKKLRIIPVRFIRPEKRFSSAEELKSQIAEDYKYIKEK